MKFTRQVAASLAVAASVAAAGTAQAQITLVAGSAAGCFYTTVSCTPVAAPSTATLGGATYYSSTFSGSTSGGSPNKVSFGSVSGAGTTSGHNNFGSVTLTGAAQNYNGNFFNLLLTFTSPAAANQTFTALVTGTVVSSSTGNFSIDFGADQTFFYGPGYFFTTHVNDLDILPGDTAPITGNVIVTTPEPSSMALLGTGLVGLVPMIRRRRK